MIDKIKIQDTNYSPDFILNNYKWKEVKIDDDINKIGLQTNLTNKSRMFSLRMLLTENLKTGTYTLSIDGSIRKWYFDKNSRKDLSYKEYNECIEILGEKLGLKKEEVWKKFKITQLEIGATLLLKSFTNDILDCFVKYRNAERDDKYESTIYFKFKNYDLVIYDKFLEMHQGKIWTKNELNIFNKFLFFRIEISVTKVSGSTFKKKYDTLELLKCNWKELPTLLHDYLDKIEFVDLISDEKKTETVTRIDFLNKLYFLGMKSIGIHETIMDFNKLAIPNNKSKYFKDLMNIYKSNITSERNYKAEILHALKTKTNRLYNKSNIR
jgi:hypothetical protein